ncbi:hypothetical protein MWU49_05975 [Alcanivorax sp. S6407]|uniref:hypothetical protein n=1 Tax=Alcanivorax sp. S6407 TaxID=2926424 RepID=UPI001FF52DA0|nr:hypothetical protein [Alcanivorax sp. S6407]MCK0153238.1 hypothetical protein [Alcanivorax sp. S6407]
MKITIFAMLGMALVTTPALAETSNGDLEQRLREYEQRLQRLEQQELEGTLNNEERLTINGFLSAGMSRADAPAENGDATFVDGSGDEWSHDALTRAGVQFNASINDRAQAVVQMVATGVDNFDAEIQWGYLDYALSDSVSVKAGRIVAPFYMHSQYVDVGYAYPWVTPPAEVYLLAPIKTMEGMELAWSFSTGPVFHRLAGFWGSSTVDSGARAGGVTFQADDLSGINLTSRWNDWTLRAAYSGASVTVADDELDGLSSGLTSLLGLTFDKVYTYFGGVGLQYDNGSWFFASEAALLNFGNWYPSARSGYVSLGKYLGKWMPLVTWTSVEGHDLEDSYLPQLEGSGIDPRILQDQLAEQQKGWTAGLRYSLTDSVALKGEYSYYYDFSDDELSSNGFFSTDGGPLKDDHASVVRLSVDLVF